MKNKGFTLVELLTVMALLSIIAFIVYPTVEDYVSGARNKAYNTQIDNIEAAAKNWAADNISKLPDEGETYTITLGTLISGNYIDEVENPNTKSNFPTSTKIKISNIDGAFIYEVLE